MSNEGMNLPELDIDLRGDEFVAWGGQGGPKLPIGGYTMDLVNVEEATSKKGGPVAKVTFKVADEGEFLGVELTKSYSLQTKPSKEGGVPAIGRFKNLMMAAGASLDKIRFSELLGARVIVDVIHVEGEGKVGANGEVVPGGVYCDIVNERAIAMPEPVPAPPPATKAKPPAQQAQAQAQPTRNGSPAARRA